LTAAAAPARRLAAPLRWSLAACAVWGLGVLLGSAWQLSGFLERENARFAGQFDSAFTVVAQRLEQNEALLDGLVALLRSNHDKEFPKLRDYANETLKRYPHLYTVGYQPRIGLAQREAFEQRMGQRLGRPFRIRDFSFAGDRTWRVSPPRPFYFPVTFMAPELANAQDVIGYDVHDDARFRAAIERSAQLDRPVATLPFDLVEGGRGYIYLRALRLSADGESAIGAPNVAANVAAVGTAVGAAGHAPPPEHLISLLIRADRLFLGVGAPAGARLTLRTRDAPEAAAAFIGGIGEAPEAASANALRVALPELQLQRATPSLHQPFELELLAQPAWSGFAWKPWSLWVGAWTALVFASLAGALAFARSQRLQRQARQQADLARQDLAAAERRAESSRAHSLDGLGSGIAHELSQPLAAVVGYSQAALRMLQSEPAPSDELLERVRETLQANAQQALRAGELMQRLRTLVRRQTLQMQPLVVQDVVASALRLEQARIKEGAVAVDTRLPEAGVALLGDAMLLEQLLTNLLRNAVEALARTPLGQRRIAIELRVEADRCLLGVSDNGPGMSAEQVARAFHPFQSTKAAGVGIGLAVCAAIAQAHGGDIAAEGGPQSACGGGARFVVTLPLAGAPVAASAAGNAASDAPTPIRPTTAFDESSP
jgi:two-component system, LuxR family, sensor kinase FixL